MTTIPQLSAALGDRYRVEREIGAGGMATVYLARDLKHDRDVALKLLRPDLAAVLGTERFLQEIRIAPRRERKAVFPLPRISARAPCRAMGSVGWEKCRIR